MKDIKKQFAAAAFTATLAFNVAALDTDSDKSPSNDVNNTQTSEASDDYLLSDEYLFGNAGNQNTSEHILPLLDNLQDRRDVMSALKAIRHNPAFGSVSANIDNADSLDSYLEFSGDSPYLTIPLLMGMDRNKYLNSETLETLEKHGFDLKVFDDVIQARTNGSMHLHDLLDEPIKEILSNPYVYAQASTSTEGYDTIPKPILRTLEDDLELYKRARALIEPGYSANNFNDINPLAEETITKLPHHELKSFIRLVSDEGYETALLNRKRDAVSDVQESLEENYKGINFEGGIHYEYADGLSLPEQNTDYELVIVEPDRNVHSDVTHRYAEGLATQISPDGEGASDVTFLATDDDFTENSTLVNLAALGADTIILSKSYGISPTGLTLDDGFIDDVDTSAILQYSFHENNKTIQFIAAGNSYNKYTFNTHGNEGDLKDSYRNAASVSQAESHAQRSVTIGAGHVQGSTLYMPSYTSIGADFLMETPDFYGSKAQGTSFSTPTAAEYYHQVAESFGDALSHEEIMIAALYSTETNIYNVNNATADILDMNFGDDQTMQTSDITDTLKKNEKSLPEESIQSFNKTVFRTNDAGVPFHERAGAGFLNVDTWIENLEKLKVLKGTFEHEAGYSSEAIPLAGKQTEIEDSQFKYKYTIKADQDITLDKQTLYLDHKGLNSIRMTTPAGMQADFIGTHSGYVSTRAFAGEDIKAGDEIIIESAIELGELSEFTLRGFEDGNAVQAFRDHALENDGLKPNAVYKGNTLTEFDREQKHELEYQYTQASLSEAINEPETTPVINVGPQPITLN